MLGALAAGRPVAFVGNEGGEIARLIREHDAGIVVGHGHGAELAIQVQLLAREPERVNRMGINARRFLESEYFRSNGINSWNLLLRTCED